MKAFVCMGCGHIFHLKSDEELCPKCEKVEQERIDQIQKEREGDK